MSGTIALFFGTRPQVIKSSVLRSAFGARESVVAIDTGQHYDHALHQVHYDQLRVNPPDVYLGVGSESHAKQTAAILTAAAEWIEAHRPSVAVVIGDTNSTLACALAAAKARIPVAHVEAGLRAQDRMMAEEINRRAVDSFAEVLFAPSERAARTLRRERVDGEVHLVGDVAYDVLKRAATRVTSLPVVGEIDPSWGDQFIYVTLHRAELVDQPERLERVMKAISVLPWPSLFAVHPRTAAALERLRWNANGRVKLREPLGYIESLAVLKQAQAVVTDSGGIQREAYWLGVPCVTMRAETEWGETVECGANRLVQPEAAEDLARSLSEAIGKRNESWDRSAYGDGDAAVRIAAILSDRFGASASSSV